MTLRSRYPLLLAALLLVPAAPLPAADDPVGTTLQQVKSSYRDKKYPQAEEALRHLAELLAAPEREELRPKVLPALHFYSAAVAWAEKDEERARASLRQFFALTPDAAIDPAAYPKSFRIFFEAQRNEAAKSAAASPAGPESIAGGVLPAYATSDVDASAIPANTGAADWDEGPVRFLMDEGEKKAWRALADDDARRSFVNDFWRRRDPRAATDQNEFEIEFYRRVQYADANFSTESVRGSLSDRGMVFVLLGPPSYVGRSTIYAGLDPMNRLRAGHMRIAAGTTEGELETWYYKRDRVMKGLPFSELQYQFVTRRGYGTGVLQKDPIPLTALKKAARLIQSANG